MMGGGDGELDQVDLFSQALAQLSSFTDPFDDGSNADPPEPQVQETESKAQTLQTGLKSVLKNEIVNTNSNRSSPVSVLQVKKPDTAVKVDNYANKPPNFVHSSLRPAVPQQTTSLIRLTGNNNSQRIVVKATPGTGGAKLPLKVPAGAGASTLQHGQTLMLNNQPVRVVAKPGPDGKTRYQLVSLPGAGLTPNKSGLLTQQPGGINGKQAPPLVFEVEEEEELGYTDTYADYMPMKLKFGRKHPDSVVETSSLSSVEPRDISYRVAIPEHVIDEGLLSALQLESITYCGQKHEEFLQSGERAGFFIGDGAGVGKGRTIAGLIYDNYLRGRKRALWFSTSTDLKVDAERDLNDINAGKIQVHPLNKLKYAKISSSVNNNIKKGVIFSTYSSLIGESQTSGKYSTRLKQLLNWCGPDFDGLVVFDECHKAKNLCPTGSSKPTKTGLMVLELQNSLPKARVVYASATGASEPKNMAYMTRLGLWGMGTPFKEFTNFIQAIERGGVGAMELVAMDMKLRGMYIARQLSFHGVSFKIDQVPISRDFVEIYNKSVELWCLAREKFHQSCEVLDSENKLKKNMWGQFWSAHQRFFKYLCISAKVPHLVKVAREAVKNGKCVVIGLQSTGEARTLEQLEEQGGELNDFVSTAKGVFQTLLEKHFPTPDRLAHGKFLELMGITGSLNDSPSSSPKRKRPGESTKPAKRPRPSWMIGADDSDDDSTNCPPSVKSVSNLPESDVSSSSSDSDDDDNSDTNPFAAFGSDSDEDNPWLSNKPKKKEKKKKEKRAKNEDSEFDAALKAAGLLRKGSLPMSTMTTESPKQPAPVARLQHTIQRPSSASPTIMRTSAATSPAFKLPDGVEPHEFVLKAKQELQAKLDDVGDRLPPNSLDQLVDLLGGTENVAEMTGRKGRVVTTDQGYVQYESRSENDVTHEMLNLAEKQRFMNGDKYVAIISEAASSGISLQSDRRVLNQRRRVHITLELPWSADRAIQQFGRTHRSNQVNAPEYIFLISELAGEQRFAATVAKRLESLGALTHGDRRATEMRDLSQFNIDNKYGRQALSIVMRSVLGAEAPLVSPPSDHQGDFFRDLREALIGVGMLSRDKPGSYPMLEKDYNNISKFLNRILGMKVGLQNKLFKYFTDTLASVILQAKRDYKWDMGIMDLGSGTENVKVVRRRPFPGDVKLGTSDTELYTVSVERGITWQDALDTWTEFTGRDDGFYISRDQVNKATVILAGAMSGAKKRLYTIHKPNTGQQTRPDSLEVIKKKYKRVTPDEAQVHWENHYLASAHQCSHAYWHGRCRNQSSGMACEVGLRTRSYHILAGSVLSVWTRVETVVNQMSGQQFRMQIVRLKTDDDKRIVGCLIPPACVKFLSDALTFRAVADAPTRPMTPTSMMGGGRNSPMTTATVGSGGATASFRAMAAAANPFSSLIKTSATSPATRLGGTTTNTIHKSYSMPSAFL